MSRTTVAAVGVLAAAAALLLPPGATAQGIYIGGAYAWVSQDTDNPGFNADVFESESSGYRVFAGLELGNFFGAEGTYTRFGSYDALALEGFDETPAEAESDGWGLALTARVPLGDRLTAYAKAGYFFWDAAVTGSDDFLDQWGEAASSGEDPFYGVGVRFNTGKVSLFGEWERYQMDQFDFTLVNVGVRLYF